MKKQYTLLLSLALVSATPFTPVYADSNNGTVQTATTTIIQNGVNNHAVGHTEQGTTQYNVGEGNSSNVATQISNALISQIGNGNSSRIDVQQWLKQRNKRW